MGKTGKISIFLIALVWMGCGAQPMEKPAFTTSSTTLNPGESEKAVRVVFHQNYFTDLNDFNASNPPPTLNSVYGCLGDVTKVHHVDGPDYSGTPDPFPSWTVADDFSPTYRPKFIRHVSVDMTNTFFPNVLGDLLQSDQCSFRTLNSTPVPWSCADFDYVPNSEPTATGTPTPTPTPIPTPTPTTSEYFNSGYYRVRDDYCAFQGPQNSPDVEITKARVGGVNIDLDRFQLGTSEDLLMIVTYHALGEFDHASAWPSSISVGKPSSAHDKNDHTVLKVHLMSTSQGLDQLISATQPRSQSYSDEFLFPIHLKEIATLEDPYGGLRSEQVYIPLSQNFLADRIRIERNRGSFHLFQVDLYRLGNRGQ